VATGSLGSTDTVLLPEGDYRVQLHSSPPVEANISLSPREQVTMTLEKRGDEVVARDRRGSVPYLSCDDPGQLDSLLGSSPL
jgi:hypothetical protein